ncbi:MAG: transketolase family protein [Candidatus Gastranaerophilales bacterium]|nr:transketolase family protein [Candidatus Gastranaerophilales bacterium]
MLINSEEKKSPRNTYGETLVELGAKNHNIVVLDADLSCSTQTAKFARVYPDRFFNCGIAEQDMICTAAGLAFGGKTVFASTFAMFATARCLDQIRNTVCYSKLDVKIVATHGGITVGEDGASHQALEDIAYMRAIPEMKVIVPADCTEVNQIIEYAAKTKGPMYIRIPRTNLKNLFDPEKYKFNPTSGVKLKDGKDITIVSNGETLAEVLEASKKLQEVGIETDVIHYPVVKPFHSAALIASAQKTKRVVVVENHSVIGGLGSAVCEELSIYCPSKVYRIGTKDTFGQSGEQRQLMEFYGLTDKKIYEKIIKFMDVK